MNYLFLGCDIEYKKAARRLEELTHAPPGSWQAQERKELVKVFVLFERETQKIALGENSKS